MLATTDNKPEVLDRLPILGVPVHLGRNYLGWLLARLRSGQGTHVVTLNAEMTMQARENPVLAQIIDQADLVVPDGSGVVLYLRLKGRRIQKVAGIELAASLLQTLGHNNPDRSVFFYGGAPGVVERAAQYWQRMLPNLTIAGTQHGYMDLDEQEDFQQYLKQHQPDVVLVGLGVPRQELWISQYRHLCPRAIWIGVGGSLDVWAGIKKRAPRWMQKTHLEWFYRLCQEPWRWRRMMALPMFALQAFKEIWK